MSNILIFKIKPQKLNNDRFIKIAQQLGIESKIIETEDAIAVYDSKRALAYAQPGARFGGFLFFTNQTQSIGDLDSKPLSTEIAKAWTEKFLFQHHLIPKEPREPKIKFQLKMQCFSNEAKLFDGKKRKSQWITTNAYSQIYLNGILVCGPRGRVRMIFKNNEIPIMIHCGIWSEIEIFEERELIPENVAIESLKANLTGRKDTNPISDISNVRLSYFAGEYTGGPDLLHPYYFMDVEFEDKRGKKMGITKGIKQMICVNATK
jgi:hypothetical protein